MIVRSSSAVKWLVWSLTILFLFYEFFIRVFPTAIVGDLMLSFHVTALQLGTLSAFYFYAYAPMQIPVGLLMDRFGARLLLTIACLLCAGGSFFFGLTEMIGLAQFGRFLMGVGSAFGFIGMVYISSHWFPAKQLALLVGLGNSIGMLGAVAAEGPMTVIVRHMGWRLPVVGLGIIGVLIALFIYLAIRKENAHEIKKGQVHKASVNLVNNLKQVCNHYRMWLNAFIALLFYMTTAGFASLWGIPFLVQSYGIDKELAGFIVSMIFVGWIVGGPIIGFISDHFKKRKPFLYICTLLTALCLIPVIYLPEIPVFILFLLLFFVGVFSSAELLQFSLAVEFNPAHMKGTSIAMTNFIVAIGSSIVQPLLGFFLDMEWDGLIIEGLPFYSTAVYRKAMTLFPCALFLAFILLFFLKEEKAQVKCPGKK